MGAPQSEPKGWESADFHADALAPPLAFGMKAPGGLGSAFPATSYLYSLFENCRVAL